MATQQFVECEAGAVTWGGAANTKTPAQIAAEAAAAAQAQVAQLSKKKKKKGELGGITSMRINVGADLNKWKASQERGPDNVVSAGVYIVWLSCSMTEMLCVRVCVYV